MPWGNVFFILWRKCPSRRWTSHEGTCFSYVCSCVPVASNGNCAEGVIYIINKLNAEYQPFLDLTEIDFPLIS